MKVVRTENSCFGRPRIDGTRLEVYNIISDLAYSENYEKYMEERSFSKKDIEDIISYCKNLKCQKMKFNFERYCSGCILSTLHEKFNYKEINLVEIGLEKFIDKNNPNFIAFGNKSELEDELSGRPGWIIAEGIKL